MTVNLFGMERRVVCCDQSRGEENVGGQEEE